MQVRIYAHRDPARARVRAHAVKSECDAGIAAFAVKIHQRTYLAQRMRLWPCISSPLTQLVGTASTLDQESSESSGPEQVFNAVASTDQANRSGPTPDGDGRSALY